MANLGCLFVCTFGDYLVLVLIAAHTANNLDLGRDPEDEGSESKGPENLTLAWPREIK